MCRKGLIYFPDFCQLVLSRYLVQRSLKFQDFEAPLRFRNDGVEDDLFRQNMFKVTSPFSPLQRCDQCSNDFQESELNQISHLQLLLKVADTDWDIIRILLDF